MSKSTGKENCPRIGIVLYQLILVGKSQTASVIGAKKAKKSLIKSKILFTTITHITYGGNINRIVLNS